MTQEEFRIAQYLLNLPKSIEAIENQDFDKLYKVISENAGILADIGLVTQLLYESDINPFNYMNDLTDMVVGIFAYCNIPEVTIDRRALLSDRMFYRSKIDRLNILDAAEFATEDVFVDCYINQLTVEDPYPIFVDAIPQTRFDNLGKPLHIHFKNLTWSSDVNEFRDVEPGSPEHLDMLKMYLVYDSHEAVFPKLNSNLVTITYDHLSIIG